MVEREYPKFLFAGFGTRLLAFLIDLFSIKCLMAILGLPLVNLLGLDRTARFFSWYNLINLTIYLGYFFLLTYFNKGQTLGKMLMGIRVISLDQDDLSLDTVFYREVLGRFILKKLSIFYLMMLFNRNRQDLADFFAGTSVVTSEYFYEYLDLLEAQDLTQEDFYRGEEVLIANEEDLDRPRD